MPQVQEVAGQPVAPDELVIRRYRSTVFCGIARNHVIYKFAHYLFAVRKRPTEHRVLILGFEGTLRSGPLSAGDTTVFAILVRPAVSAFVLSEGDVSATDGFEVLAVHGHSSALLRDGIRNESSAAEHVSAMAQHAPGALAGVLVRHGVCKVTAAFQPREQRIRRGGGELDRVHRDAILPISDWAHGSTLHRNVPIALRGHPTPVIQTPEFVHTATATGTNDANHVFEVRRVRHVEAIRPANHRRVYLTNHIANPRRPTDDQSTRRNHLALPLGDGCKLHTGLRNVKRSDRTIKRELPHVFTQTQKASAYRFSPDGFRVVLDAGSAREITLAYQYVE
jgi:hypothetical protein